MLLSVASEIIISTLMAPILLAYQSRAVVQILLGLDGGWPATARDAQVVPFRTALQASWWISLGGLAGASFMLIEAPAYVLWLLPVAVPAMLAPVIIWATSHGRAKVDALLFGTVAEREPAPIMRENERVLAEWAMPVHGPVLAPNLVSAHA